MNKNEFIKELIQLYDDFTEKNKIARIKAYNVVLKGDINYDCIFVNLMQTYKSFNFAPSPAHLFELVEKERRRLALNSVVKMNKVEFIEKLVSRFSYYTEKDTKDSFKDTYERVLTKKINYEVLWNKFCNEYESKTPPTGVELNRMAKTCYLEEAEKEYAQWVQVEAYNTETKQIENKDVFEVGTTIEEMIKTYEKKFNCSGWKILRVY